MDAAIGCRPDAADAERDMLGPAKCLVIIIINTQQFNSDEEVWTDTQT